jgi:hypothetical protein
MSLSSLSFEIEGHSVTMVEVDGHYSWLSIVRNLCICIYSGKTYSVIVKANQDTRRSYLAVVDCQPCKTASGKYFFRESHHGDFIDFQTRLHCL